MLFKPPSYPRARTPYALHLDKLPKHKRGWVVSAFESLKLAKQPKNYNQIYSLYIAANSKTTSDQYSLTFTDLGKLFGFSRHNARHCYYLGLKSTKNQPISRRGRPSEIQPFEWINNRFEKSLSSTWLYHYLANPKNGLFEVSACPLENERIEVTENQLIKYCERAEKFLTKIDSDFEYLIPMDMLQCCQRFSQPENIYV